MGRLEPGGVAFAALAILTLGSAVVVALSHNLIRSVVALLGTLAGVAGLYALLAADFVATAQLLVYAGGTLSLFLFAALATTPPATAATSNAPGPRGRARFFAGLLTVGLVAVAIRTVWPVQDVTSGPTTAKLGHALLGEYALPFELAALVLLAAMIGATTVARRAPNRAERHPR